MFQFWVLGSLIRSPKAVLVLIDRDADARRCTAAMHVTLNFREEGG